MYCLPLDDVCQMEQFRYEVIAEAGEKTILNNQDFFLGEFNGRTFFYSTSPTLKPMIIIIEQNKSQEYNAAYAEILKGD
jgi:hypothetical protein